jgi:hypothetical protein
VKDTNHCKMRTVIQTRTAEILYRHKGTVGLLSIPLERQRVALRDWFVSYDEDVHSDAEAIEWLNDKCAHMHDLYTDRQWRIRDDRIQQYLDTLKHAHVHLADVISIRKRVAFEPIWQ